MIEVELPDGTIAEFPDGTSRDVMRTALQKRFGKPQPQQSAAPDDVRARWDAARAGTLEASPESLARHEAANAAGAEAYPPGRGLMDQVTDALGAGAAGVSRGITGMMDMPGAALDAGARSGAWAAEKLGLASPAEADNARAVIDQVGEVSRLGDGTANRDAMAQATGGASEFRGDTTLGKYAGTVGEFLPGSFGGGGGMLRNALTYGVIPGIASEGAGQLTEGTPLEPWARVLAPMLASALAARATRPAGPQAPSVDDLKSQAEGLYQSGAARQGADAASVQGLAAQIDGELQNLNIKTPTGQIVADGNVKKFLNVLEDYQGQPMKPEQMQTARRILQDAAGSADPSDRRIGTALLEKFDDWRNSAVPEYEQADALYSRMKRAKDVDFRIEKADRRAASTGTGGNSVNAARQNIRQILDNPKAARGYSPEELAMMEDIVRGTRTTNALRLAGRLSPTSGALPLMGNLAGIGVAPHVAIPAMGLASAAKGTAEVLTNGQINALSSVIRNGGPLATNALAQARRGLLPLTAVRAINAEQWRTR